MSTLAVLERAEDKTARHNCSMHSRLSYYERAVVELGEGVLADILQEQGPLRWYIVRDRAIRATSRRRTGWVGQVGRSRPGRRGYPPQHWRDVAEVFLDAQQGNGPLTPLGEVRALWGLSDMTARNWVKQARRRGLLNGSAPAATVEQDLPSAA